MEVPTSTQYKVILDWILNIWIRKASVLFYKISPPHTPYVDEWLFFFEWQSVVGMVSLFNNFNILFKKSTSPHLYINNQKYLIHADTRKQNF